MITQDKKPIGVFDSGIGGLSTLKVLKEALPYESFTFFGDLANLPYGTKSQDFLEKRVSHIINHLSKTCKAVIIACNTASIAILKNPELLNSFSVPVLNVIHPVLDYFKKHPSSISPCVTILATKSTIESGFYQNALLKIDPSYKVNGIIAQEWVALIEQLSDYSDQSLIKSVNTILDPLENDPSHTVILGCTHFAFIENLIKARLDQVKLVNSSIEVTSYLKDLLTRESILNLEGKGKDQVITSSHSPIFEKMAQKIVDRSTPITINPL